MRVDHLSLMHGDAYAWSTSWGQAEFTWTAEVTVLLRRKSLDLSGLLRRPIFF